MKSGKLEWSPLHTNPAFWRENAQKLNQNDHEVLRMIRILLKDEQDPTTLAVCAHDVGEYVRHYPVVRCGEGGGLPSFAAKDYCKTC